MIINRKYHSLAEFCEEFARNPRCIFDLETITTKERLFLTSGIAYNHDAFELIKDWVRSDEEAEVLALNNPETLSSIPSAFITEAIIKHVAKKFPDKFFKFVPHQYINEKTINAYLNSSETRYVPDKYTDLLNSSLLSKIALKRDVFYCHPNLERLFTKEVSLNTLIYYCNNYYKRGNDFTLIHNHPTYKRVIDSKPIIGHCFSLKDPIDSWVEKLTRNQLFEFDDILKISDKFTNSGYDNLIRICSRIFGDDKASILKMTTNAIKKSIAKSRAIPRLEDLETPFVIYHTPKHIKESPEYINFLFSLKNDYRNFNKATPNFLTLDTYKILDYFHFENLCHDGIYSQFIPCSIEHELILERTLGVQLYKKYLHNLPVRDLCFDIQHIITWGKDLISDNSTPEYKRYQRINLV